MCWSGTGFRDRSGQGTTVEQGGARDLERPAGALAVRTRPFAAEVNMDGGAGHSPRPGSCPGGAHGLEEDRELEKESLETAKRSPAQRTMRRGRRDHGGG